MTIQNKGLEHTWFLALMFLCAYTTDLRLNHTQVGIPARMGGSLAALILGMGRKEKGKRNIVDKYIEVNTDCKLLFYNLKALVCDP